jgi:hypothetical protein
MFSGVLTSPDNLSVAAGDVPIFRASMPGPGVDSPNNEGRTNQSCEPSSEAGSSEGRSIILRASKHQVELMSMESEAWSLLSSAAGMPSPALQKDAIATANVLSPLLDQPGRCVSVEQSTATPATDGGATEGVVGTTLGIVDEGDGDVSQPPGRAAPSTPAQFVEQAEETFHHVEQRSEAIAASYKRTADAPTDRTYREAQSLLQAMGVPVVITEGGEEAEAVASALVLEGNGDYVATEDTVSNPYFMETLLWLMDWLGCPHLRRHDAP